MSESTLSASPVKSTRAKVTLTDTPRVLSTRRARGMVRRAKYVAVYVTVGPNGAADLLDVSKACVMKMLRRRDRVWISELFGSIIIGRPEPI